MARWFARLMQTGHARSSGTIAGAKQVDAGKALSARDTRFDSIVQSLRAREADDRAARERRQRGYRQSLESDSAAATGTPASIPPVRLNKFRTKVPCRMSAEARTLLDEIRRQFPGGTISFPQLPARTQAIVLATANGAEPTEIGRVEQCVQTDPTRCNVRDQGLSVETDGGTKLVLRFRYPATSAKMSSRELASRPIDERAVVDFTEIRPALDLRPSDRSGSPRLVWITRPEVETMNALQSRDYEAFYVRFKLEVQAGIWSSLSALLSSAPGTRWHHGSCYTVIVEPDAADRRIYQRTVDDSGRATDIGADRIYDAGAATDILLLYLDGDILIDFADIYFTLQSLASADAYVLKEEFFTIVRRFWTSAASLASHHDSDLATALRISQRVLPLPVQAPLVKQDWTSLRQSLVDRYGERGRKAGELATRVPSRPRVRQATWPFETFPAGEVNIGLRVVYRQEWRDLGAERGQVIRAIPAHATPVESAAPTVAVKTKLEGSAQELHRVETTIVPGERTRSLDEIVASATTATIETMKWLVDFEGSIQTGARSLATTTDLGLEPELREISRDTTARLSDTMRKMACRARDELCAEGCDGAEEDVERSFATSVESPADGEELARVYSRLQKRYEILTRPAELQNIVLVAERLPTPAEIDVSWVRRHDWILAKVLLDESFRDALRTIGHEARTPQRSLELEAKRDPLYEHIRANILHYQRAIWQREDPEQRRMRYRKSGTKVPLDWRFELESGGAMTIDDLCDRLDAPNVDGQFASYSQGREAELDQLIDPAGPIGYCGNYAMYHMRPEFGSNEMFSMLHFFKSPYLRPTPETGEIEVEDPVQIQTAETPAASAAGDHRVRQLVLDTDGVIVDVVRRAEPAPEEPEAPEEPSRSEEGDGLVAAVACDQLLLDSDRGMEMLRASVRREAQYDWSTLRDRSEPGALLLAGSAHEAAASHEPGMKAVMLARSDEQQMPALRAGRVPDPGTRCAIGAKERTPALLAGTGAVAPDDKVIVARDAGRLRPLSRGSVEAFEPQPPAIMSSTERAPMRKLAAGMALPDADAHVVVAADVRRLRLTADAAGSDHAHEPVILAEAKERLRPSLVAR